MGGSSSLISLKKVQDKYKCAHPLWEFKEDGTNQNTDMTGW